MQEHQHVKTIPGEPVSPEIVPHAVRAEPGAHTQAEDINIPILIICVIFFAVFLTVAITGLQAAYYTLSEAERVAKTVPQGAPGTPLGVQLTEYHHDLYDPVSVAPWNQHAGYGEANKVRRVPIDVAMDATVQKYAATETPEPASK